MNKKKLYLFFFIILFSKANYTTDFYIKDDWYKKYIESFSMYTSKIYNSKYFFPISLFCLYPIVSEIIKFGIKKFKLIHWSKNNNINLISYQAPSLQENKNEKNDLSKNENFRGFNNNYKHKKENSNSQSFLSLNPILNSHFISWDKVYINQDLKNEILNFGKFFFNKNRPQDIIIPDLLFLYGLPGMDKSNIVKGLGAELNIPVFIFDPLLLPPEADLNYLVQYIENKNTDCIVLFKDFERFSNNKALFIKLYQLFHYGKNNFFKTNKQVLIVFSCSEDYIIQNLNIHHSNYSKMFVIQYADLDCRKKLINGILNNYEEYIDIKNINIDNIALLFKNLTNKDIKNIIIGTCNKLILNYEFGKKLSCNYYDIIDEYKKYIQNNTIINSKETELNKGLLEFNLLLAERSKISFSDIIGLQYIKDRLSIYINIYNNPEYYKKLEIEIPRGILFVGQPGCGKTLLAKALATECNIPFINVNGSDIINKYVGSGASKIREIFDLAKSYGKAIIYIDEIDSIGTKKSNSNDGGDKEHTQTLNALLVEMDGFINNESNQILVIGSTNRNLDHLEPALVRRFEDKYYFDLPTYTDRKELFTYYAKNIIFEETITPEYLAAKTIGYSSADVVTLLKNIKYCAIQNQSLNNLKSEPITYNEKLYITKENFNSAYYSHTIGYIIPNFEVSSQELRKTAIHELGHSLCQLYLEKFFIKQENNTFTLDTSLIETDSDDKDKLYYFDLVTIEPRSVPHGTILGFSSFVKKSEYHANSIFELEKKIISSLGGYCAEKTFLGYTTDGVGSDLKNANNIAKYIVLSGMDNTLFIDEKKVLTTEQSKQVENILQNCLKECFLFIESQADLLLFLVDKLLEKKTLYRKEVISLISEFYNNKKALTII